MRPKHVSHHRLANLHTPELLSDFDNTEVETEELVREVQCGHSFNAEGMSPPKASTNNIYSL